MPSASNQQGENMSNTEQKTASPTLAIGENRAEVNGQTIHYLKAGTGPALVLVHGYPSLEGGVLPPCR
jgi:hypothetical protein